MRMQKDFLWGGATAANQCEGGWQKGDRGMALVDVIPYGKNRMPVDLVEYQNDRWSLSALSHIEAAHRSPPHNILALLGSALPPRLWEKFGTTGKKSDKNKVRYWITFNEINMLMHLPFMGAGICFFEGEDEEPVKYQGVCVCVFKVLEFYLRKKWLSCLFIQLVFIN